MSGLQKELLCLKEHHTGRIKALCGTGLRADGQPVFISGGEDLDIHITNAISGDIIQTIPAFNGRPGHPGHRDKIYCIAIWTKTIERSKSKSKKQEIEHYIISTGEDRLLRLWELDTGASVKTIPSSNLSGIFNTELTHEDYVHSLVVIDDFDQCITASYDRTIRIWDLIGGVEVRQIKQDKVLYDIAVNVESASIASTNSLHINIWNIAGESKIDSILRYHKRTVTSLSWPRPNLLLSCSDDKMMNIWDPTDKENPLKQTLEHQQTSCQILIYEDDKCYLAISAAFGSPNSVRIWNWEQPEEEEDGKVSAPPPDNEEVEISEPEPLVKLLESFIGHDDKVCALAICDDGKSIDSQRKKDQPAEIKRIASASWDGSIRIWDLQKVAEGIHRAKFKKAAQTSRMV